MSDPNWANVALLLPCNGTNGSTSLVDLSNNADSKTIAAGAALSTTRSKWGSASLKMTHVSADLSAWSGSRFNRALGTNYTIECWIYVPTGTAYAEIFEIGEISCRFDSASGDLVVVATSTNTVIALPRDQWVFLQYIAKSTNVFEFRVDGTLELTDAVDLWSGADLYVARGTGGPYATATEFYIDDFRVTPGIARSTTVPTAAFPIPAAADAIVSAAGPLGSPEIVSSAAPAAIVSDTGPLGVPEAVSGVELRVLVQDTGPLGSMLAVMQHDFTSSTGNLLTRYVMDIGTTTGTVRLPISSWQATLQTDRQCYVQCVVPACSPYVDDLNDATSFAIFRRVVLPSGYAVEAWMAGAPITNLQFARGSANYTATISGYSDAFTADDDPPEALDRTMTNVRMISSSNGVSRASCDIDWLLRPGMRAYVNEAPLLVGWINYYVNDSGEYMDVGESSEAG